MSTMHWLEVWRMWKFLGSSAWQRWENVPFLLKRASFDTRLFWAISGPNMFFTTLFCANGGSQSASVHRMVPYTITWSTMINIYRDFGLKGFPMEFESRDRNSWTICLVVLTILKNMSSSNGIMTFPSIMESHKTHVPNHQPAVNCPYHSDVRPLPRFQSYLSSSPTSGCPMVPPRWDRAGRTRERGSCSSGAAGRTKSGWCWSQVSLW
jgi:hypothetical protein